MWPFNSTPKLWRVGEHRVKKVRRYPQGNRAFKCVDCEQTRGYRERFERVKCYEVIHDGDCKYD